MILVSLVVTSFGEKVTKQFARLIVCHGSLLRKAIDSWLGVRDTVWRRLSGLMGQTIFVSCDVLINSS